MSARPAELPRAFEPWRDWLGWFEPELAEQLGTLVQRLANLVGPARGAASAGREEPDGLGDLRSRGAYERLLASEWLLAEEQPDEFLRRATSAEHLFMTPRLRAPRVDRDVFALFDAGPRQLGVPRLGQLAAWILLARRAIDLGGRLRWGVLQQPDMLRPATDVEQLRTLLRARSYAPVDETHLAAWQALLAATEDPTSRTAPPEVWWIGAAAPSDALRARTLALRASLDRSALEVALDDGGGARNTSLPLPPERAAVALLRGEFRPVVLPTAKLGASERISSAHEPFFSPRTGHVATWGRGDSEALVFTLPQAGRHCARAPRRQAWSTARPPLGFLLDGQRAGAVCVDGDRLHFWQIDGFVPRPRPPRDEFDTDDSGQASMPLALLRFNDARRVCAIDRRRRLVYWDMKPLPQPKGGPALVEAGAPPPMGTMEDGVLGMAQLSANSAAYLVSTSDGLYLARVSPVSRKAGARVRVADPQPQAEAVHFCAPRTGEAGEVRSLAVRIGQAPERWQVVTSANGAFQPVGRAHALTTEIELPPGERCVGLANQHGSAPPALVVVDAGHRRLLLRTSSHWSATLFETASTIAQCTVDPLRNRVALVTRAGELVVLDAAQTTPLLVVHGNAIEGAVP